VQIVLGAVVLGAVLLIGLGPGRRGGRALWAVLFWGPPGVLAALAAAWLARAPRFTMRR